MRFRTHLLASAIVGLALYPRAPRRAALVALAGVAIDIDHYLLYASRSGDWSLIGALRYNRQRSQLRRAGDTRPRYGSLRSVAHRIPLTVPLVWLLARTVPACTPLAIGLTLHLVMDTSWPMLLDYRVWRRARGRCERCGEHRRRRDVHQIVPPKHGGDYWALHNRVLWCERCAIAVRRGQGDG